MVSREGIGFYIGIHFSLCAITSCSLYVFFRLYSLVHQEKETLTNRVIVSANQFNFNFNTLTICVQPTCLICINSLSKKCYENFLAQALTSFLISSTLREAQEMFSFYFYFILFWPTIFSVESIGFKFLCIMDYDW